MIVFLFLFSARYFISSRGVESAWMGAAPYAAKFYEEVATGRSVWTIRDAAGFPAPMGEGGRRAQPFWSSRTRVERIVKTVPAYRDFEVVELSASVFLERWLPGFARDGVLVGVNWSGPRATGFDVEPDEVLASIQALLP